MTLLSRVVRPESASLGYRNELDPRFPLTLPNLVRILLMSTLTCMAMASSCHAHASWPSSCAAALQQPAAGIAIVTAEARPARGGGPPTHAWMLHDWLTADLNEMLPPQI